MLSIEQRQKDTSSFWGMLFFLRTLWKYSLCWAFFTSPVVLTPKASSSMILTPKKRKSETLSTQTPPISSG